MRELITNVHVRDEDGVDHVFRPGDVLPDWAFAQVSGNPKLFGGTVEAPTFAARVDADQGGGTPGEKHPAAETPPEPQTPAPKPKASGRKKS